MKTNSIKQESGTFHLIEQALIAIPNDQWPKKIEDLASKFGNKLALLPLQTATNNQLHQQDLQANEFVFIYGMPSVLLRRIDNSPWVISLTMGVSQMELITRGVHGPVYLALQLFESRPSEQWPELLKELSLDFPHEFVILTKLDLTLPQDKMAKLNNNELVWEVRSQNQAIVHVLLPDQKSILRVISTPVDNSFHIAIIVVIFFATVSIFLFIWVYPLWRDLKRLSITADNFGNGYLTQRAELAKSSVVSRLAHSFNQMADRIEKSIEGQKELTNAISHDLRTPLYRLRFAFEMLNCSDTTEIKQKKYRNSIDTSIDDLDHLIDQTLILSRYNRTMDISHFSTCALAEKIIDEVDYFRLENPALIVDFDISPELEERMLFVDSRALLRALNNLLSNASRYSKEHIKVSLIIDENNYQLTVEDDGPGISESQWPSVFEPFVQLKNSHRSTASGHGLGLAIVKQIALWHKGNIDISHSTLGGAKFDFSWPLQLK